jgi:hypothetical protein
MIVSSLDTIDSQSNAFNQPMYIHLKQIASGGIAQLIQSRLTWRISTYPPFTNFNLKPTLYLYFNGMSSLLWNLSINYCTSWGKIWLILQITKQYELIWPCPASPQNSVSYFNPRVLFSKISQIAKTRCSSYLCKYVQYFAKFCTKD